MKFYLKLFAFLFFLLPSLMYAHEERPAFLQIKQVDGQTFDLFWKVPVINSNVPKVEPSFDDASKMELIKVPTAVDRAVISVYRVKSNKPLKGQEIRIKGLESLKMDVLVSVIYENGEQNNFFLHPENPSGIIPGPEGSLQVIKNYTILGIEHILFGIDHLLFVLALLLITKSFKRIVKTITAFTLAHSITLSLAALGFVKIPGPPVEAVIALSIVFLALEVLNNMRGNQTLTGRKPWLVAFTFGLLHGFGFAGALAEVGLPQSAIPLALAFFNIGVELGQIGFVILVAGIMRILAVNKSWPVILRKFPAYAIGSVAMFWMIERIAGFWQ